jgi:hypothetical protein
MHIVEGKNAGRVKTYLRGTQKTPEMHRNFTGIWQNRGKVFGEGMERNRAEENRNGRKGELMREEGVGVVGLPGGDLSSGHRLPTAATRA